MAKTKRISKAEAAQMRVTIARDVIQQLIFGRFQAAKGVIFSYSDIDWDKLDDAPKVSCQKMIGKVKQCTVCAKGSVLISHIDRFNDVTNGELNRATDDNGYVPNIRSLKRYFPKKMLAEMETLFERNPFDCNNDVLGEEAVTRLVEISVNEFSDDTGARLLEIMFRLIQSLGQFIVDPRELE